MRKFCPLLCLWDSLWLDGVRLVDRNSFGRNRRGHDCIYMAHSRWNAPDQSWPGRKIRTRTDGRVALRSRRLDHFV